MNLKEMNKGLDFLRDKYGAAKEAITLKGVGATPADTVITGGETRQVLNITSAAATVENLTLRDGQSAVVHSLPSKIERRAWRRVSVRSARDFANSGAIAQAIGEALPESFPLHVVYFPSTVHSLKQKENS